jgi:hypothetical protein
MLILSRAQLSCLRSILLQAEYLRFGSGKGGLSPFSNWPCTAES